MEKKSDGLGSGGYTDKPWFLRFWDGMIATGWFPLLVRNHFHISPRRWAMALLMSLFSIMNFGLGLLQLLFWGRRIARTQLQGDPIFVIGHWRSGTTLLHELLVLDERHTYSEHLRLLLPEPFSAHGLRLPAAAPRPAAQATADGQHGGGVGLPARGRICPV